MEEKFHCSKCRVDKDRSHYKTCKKSKRGLYYYCKECTSKRNIEYRKKYKLDFASITPPPTKKCSICKEEKSSKHFYPNQYLNDKLHSYCKYCYSEKKYVAKRKAKKRTSSDE